MTPSLKRLGWLGSFAVYIPAAVLLYAVTAGAIPALSRMTGREPIFFWFLAGGLGVFVPLVGAAVLLLRTEGRPFSKAIWTERLRFRRMTGRDWRWALGGLLSAGAASALIMKGIELTVGPFNAAPPFLAFEPLGPGRYGLLALWLPFWILNILGEEILWRGVMLPRQEIAFGKHAWIVHALGWGVFHVAFGWQLLAMLVPLFFIQSYAVQKTKNSWVGVIMHGGLNGPSFLAIAFGLL